MPSSWPTSRSLFPRPARMTQSSCLGERRCCASSIAGFYGGMHLDQSARGLKGEATEILRHRQRRERNVAARAHAKRTGAGKFAGNVDRHGDTVAHAREMRTVEDFFLPLRQGHEPRHIRPEERCHGLLRHGENGIVGIIMLREALFFPCLRILHQTHIVFRTTRQIDMVQQSKIIEAQSFHAVFEKTAEARHVGDAIGLSYECLNVVEATHIRLQPSPCAATTNTAATHPQGRPRHHLGYSDAGDAQPLLYAGLYLSFH